MTIYPEQVEQLKNINESTMTQLIFLKPIIGWTEVEREVSNYIDYDLENSPLEILTNSVQGSDDRMTVRFFTAKPEITGAVRLFLSSPPQYRLDYCFYTRTDLPTSLPQETHKIWRITLIRTSSLRLLIHCNNKEVLNVVLSDTLCSNYDEWIDHWTHVRKIEFFSSDSISDYYRPGTFTVI